MTEPSNPEKGRWALTAASPRDVLAKLPQLDRVMVAIRQDGLLHERLGHIETVSDDGAEVVIADSAEITRLPLDLLKTVVLDVSVEMRGKLYPRLEFWGEGEDYLFSVTGLEGGDAFLPVLAGYERSRLPFKDLKAPEGETPEVPEDDPALMLLNRLMEDKTPVQVRATRVGMQQVWQGSIEKIMAMGGYVNIITKPFHLHLEAGQVATWQQIGTSHVALNGAGQPIGLEVQEL